MGVGGGFDGLKASAGQRLFVLGQLSGRGGAGRVKKCGQDKEQVLKAHESKKNGR